MKFWCSREDIQQLCDAPCTPMAKCYFLKYSYRVLGNVHVSGLTIWGILFEDLLARQTTSKKECSKRLLAFSGAKQGSQTLRKSSSENHLVFSDIFCRALPVAEHFGKIEQQSHLAISGSFYWRPLGGQNLGKSSSESHLANSGNFSRACQKGIKSKKRNIWETTCNFWQFLRRSPANSCAQKAPWVERHSVLPRKQVIVKLIRYTIIYKHKCTQCSHLKCIVISV